MQNYNPYMQMMGSPNNTCPMMEMHQEQMEAMYPRVYNIIYPHVRNQCDMFDNQHGLMNSPTNEQLNEMVDNITNTVEHEVDMEVNKSVTAGERQLGFGGRRLLRDLVSILLIRQLIGRRRPPFYSPYPYYGGYGVFPGYGGIYG
jgi:hypothetical protein